jgi:transposase
MSDNKRRFTLRENDEVDESDNPSPNRVSIEGLHTDATTDLSRSNPNETKTAKIHFEGTIDISVDNHLELSVLANRIAELDLDTTLLEETVTSLNEELVSDYCGVKHVWGNGDKRYQRASTSTRSTVTNIGEHRFTLHYVKDTNAVEEDNTYFRPIEDILSFTGQRVYQQDILAKSVLLHFDYRLSYRKVSGLLTQTTGRNISPTTVERAGEYLYPEAREEYEAIREQIQQADVLHIDEAKFPVDSETHWLWGFTTGDETLYALRESRSSEVLEDILGETFSGVIVCDGYSAYPAFHSRLQRCWAHLFPDKYELSENDNEAQSVCESLRELRNGLEKFSDTEPTPLQRIVVQREARKRLEDIIVEGAESKQAVDILDTLQRGLGDWLRFVIHPDVPSTNNQAEAVFGEPKMMKKLMQQLQNDRGVRFYETYMSLIQTWKERDKTPYSELCRLAHRIDDTYSTTDNVN